MKKTINQKANSQQHNHAVQTAQGNKEAQVKLNAHKQTRKIGQRSSGNRGKDSSNHSQ